MWTECVKSERHTFSSLTKVLLHKKLVQFLPQLQAAGIQSACDLERHPRSSLRGILGDVLLDELLASAARPSKKSRQDIPQVLPRTRGSLQRLGIEPSPAGNNEAAQLDLEEADRLFLRDRWAATSQAPRESRWVTWTRLSDRRGFPAIPVSRQSLFSVGALLKAGGYRSTAQYISVAKQKHKQAGFVWGPDLDEARAQALRSINRGLGPSTPKLDLRLENAGPRFTQEVNVAFDELRVPQADRIRFAAQACITACWFMLRGIELANVQGRDITFNRAARTVKLQLPVRKTDTEAKGCYRVHRCICNPTHSSECSQTTPPELFGTLFQKCLCTDGMSKLCVYHALLQVVLQMRREQSWRPDTHLFVAQSSEVATKAQVVFLARACAFVLQREQLEEWGHDAVTRWSQHVFRVAGAQLFARSFLDVAYIQLLGRWGGLVDAPQASVPSLPRSTMPPTLALPDLDDVASRAGFDTEMIAYLSAKGITNAGLFLHCFTDQAKIAPFFEPLRAGFDLAGNTVKRSDDERLILEAATRVALDELSVRRSQMLAASTPVPAALPGASVSSPSSESHKVPKTLPKNYWSEYVKEFESVILLGRNREFPSHLLLGAEEVLARMVHQHQTSKQYSPVRLGEIISLRHFTPSKAANPFAPKDDSRTKMILDDSGTFTKAMRHVPEPQKLVTLLDAVEAIKWALMFSRWSDEHDASLWAEFWQNLCRDYPKNFPQIRAFLDKAFLHVSLQMRANKSFHEASSEVLTWPKQDELNRPAPFDSSEPRKGKGEQGPKGDSKGYKGKAFDKGFEGGKGKFVQQRQW
ncbi:yciC, partial [Symbiodinium sp. CCMP2456]